MGRRLINQAQFSLLNYDLDFHINRSKKCVLFKRLKTVWDINAVRFYFIQLLGLT